MVTASVLTSDQRLSFQIQTWMKDLEESVKLELHRDFSEFVKKIETEVVADLIAAAASKKDDDILDAEDIGSGKSDVFEPYYRLLIVDLELLHEKKIDPAEWAKKFKKLLTEKGRSDSLFPTQIMFMAFEGGDFDVDALRSPEIDDLIFKPLDRSVFLQKVEILTCDNPAKLKPTFLFRQKVEIPIEIGKDAVVDEMSEFAVALRNPAPIKPGVYAAIYSKAFGEGDLSRIVARSYYSEPHPTLDGQHLVYFGYFGLRGEQLATVRKQVRERQIPAKFRVPQNPVPSIEPAVPFSRVAVIDMDSQVFHEIESALKDHYIGVATQHYLSYARFLATFLKLTKPDESVEIPKPGATPGAEPVSPAKPPWTVPGPLLFKVGASDGLLKEIENSVGEEDLILGKTKPEWMLRPKAFLDDLSEHDKDELSEMYSFTLSGGKGRAFFQAKDQAQTSYYFEATSSLQKAKAAGEEPLIRVELRHLDEAQWKSANLVEMGASNIRLNPQDFRYDAIFIDANLIRTDDLQAWIDSVHEAFLKAGVFTRQEKMPRIFVLAHEKSPVKPDKYRLKGIADFLFKPLDRKMLSHKVKTVVDELIPRTEPDVPHFVQYNIDVKLAKEAKMLEISEYGLSIEHPTPFRAGTMIRFFSSQIGGGADGVIGRCSHCEKTTDKVPVYICHFTFFGVSDEILKRVRTWIREDYVHRKEAT